MFHALLQAEHQDVDEGWCDKANHMEVHIHRNHDRYQRLGSFDPAALGQEEVAHPHLFTNPGPLVPPIILVVMMVTPSSRTSSDSNIYKKL